MKKLYGVWASVVLTIASCGVVGPDYQRPDGMAGGSFAVATRGALSFAANDPWWDRLKDPTLSKFVQTALANNVEMDIALARIKESRAALGAVGPASLLSGNLTASATTQRRNEVSSDTSQILAGPSLQIDLFGQRRRRAERQRALLEAATEDEAALRLALQSEVTQTYLTARFLQASAHSRRAAVASKKRLLAILQERHQVGEATKFDLRRAQAELVLEQARLPEIEGNFQATAFALATLIAEPADQTLKTLRRGGPQPRPQGNIDPGVPSDLLRNRPDVRASEARLMAAFAEVGVEEAQLYPSLTLSGTVNGGTIDGFSFGPTFSLPLFNLPGLKANVAASVARAEAAEASYRQTVLEAVEDVQSSMAQTQALSQQLRTLQKALSIYNEAVELSRESFSLNAITLVEVLDAEEDLRDTALRLKDVRRAYAAEWADLNVAIGQGRDVRAK